ncbi:MAG: 7-cyano-7-deazaguanine synthase QueC [Candidatus Omnitrophica bacterium CG23_combo_of_CG06-09_8_20_14_all_40_11]|nr:MAG: 7-cyano-7-deazaguanine synthase QueC [Candidatus Omnitrophica bacterium CG23_combo_of_CG06-09_8_20_14_all_40_11]
MKKAIVLLSGGLDSATTLYLAKKQGYKCFCLSFDYGQRHRRELESAKKIASTANCPYQILKINLPWKGSALLDSNIVIPKHSNIRTPEHSNKIPSTYVPGRNIIFLSFALSFAEGIGAEVIFIGAHTHDYSNYPDCRPEFYRAFSRVITTGTKSGVEQRKIKIETPLIKKTKAQIIEMGRTLDVPFQFTWSCYQGVNRPCGKCDSCYYRAKGFKEAGIKDPLPKGRL